MSRSRFGKMRYYSVALSYDSKNILNYAKQPCKYTIDFSGTVTNPQVAGFRWNNNILYNNQPWNSPSPLGSVGANGVQLATDFKTAFGYAFPAWYVGGTGTQITLVSVENINQILTAFGFFGSGITVTVTQTQIGYKTGAEKLWEELKQDEANYIFDSEDGINLLAEPELMAKADGTADNRGKKKFTATGTIKVEFDEVISTSLYNQLTALKGEKLYWYFCDIEGGTIKKGNLLKTNKTEENTGNGSWIVAMTGTEQAINYASLIESAQTD